MKIFNRDEQIELMKNAQDRLKNHVSAWGNNDRANQILSERISEADATDEQFTHSVEKIACC